MTVRALAAAAAAVVASVGLPPTSLPLLPLAMAVIFGLIANSRGPREAFTLGFVAAIGLFALHIVWLPASFSALLGPAFWALFPLLLAALGAIWGGTAAAARWAGRGGVGTLIVLAPLWILVEWLRGIGFLGFPWGSLGYGWTDTPIAQWADLIGVHGLSLVTAASAAALAAPFVSAPATRFGARSVTSPFALREPLGVRRLSPALLAAAVLATGWWGGAARGRAVTTALPEPQASALLVQGDVDPFGRAVSLGRELDVHLDLTSRSVAEAGRPPDLVIWPEGAVLGYPLEGFRGEPARAVIQASSPGSAFVLGGRARVEGGSSNAVYAIAAGELTGRYDKHVLVPFGERWPLIERAAPLYRMIFRLFDLPLLQNTVPGQGPAPLQTGTGPLAAYVCYESVFPQVPRRMVAAGAGVLVNITNDAWFARGSGARQHFDMGRMRAIETRRWLLRAGNDGITAVVDPTGTTRAALPRGGPGTLEVRYARSDLLTPYVRWGGATPWILAVATLLATAFAARGVHA